MSPSPTSEGRSLSPTEARRVDRACDRFESAWRAGQRPCIADFLGDATGPARLNLLTELLCLEIAYRRLAGEEPRAEEYGSLLPVEDIGRLLSEPSPRDGPAWGTGRFGGEGLTPRSDAASVDPERTTDLSDGGAIRTAFDVSAELGASGYEILGELGRGGMGVVYRARQHGLDRLVALKMIRGGNQARPEHLSRFRVEALAVARLRHPNIVQIFDLGEVGGLPFVALELLDGGSLDDRLAGDPQSGRPAAELLATLARAVHAAHQAGIVHRDLKPSNVLFSAEGVPKVTDFGLAKRLESDSKQTESGQIMGSPSYMAPEQARGHSRDVGPPADIYALGAILYEMLTGRPPFKGETPMETVRQVVDEDPVPPSRLVPRVARDLETICLKCLNKEPSKRYDSALALAEDLARFLAGEPIRARRTPLWERGAKWARRRPFRALTTALAVLATLGLPVVTFAYWQHRSAWLLGMQDAGNRVLDRSREARTLEALGNAEANLTALDRDISGQDQLGELRRRIAGELGSVRRRIGEAQAREEKAARDLAAREQFGRFRERWSQAQVHAAGFELDTGDRTAMLTEAARAALAIYARDPGGPVEAWSLAPMLPEVLSDAERARVAEGCYDLLLLLSQAQSVEPARGLKILEQAAILHPTPTAAYHFRRADCLARAGDAAGRGREEALARRRPPVTPLDHFLIGREHLARSEIREATAALEAATRLDPGQTAAHLLLAIGYFKSEPKRLGEARVHLDECIEKHPDLVGLYLLRASVHGEEGNQALSRIDPRHPGERALLRRQADDAFRAAEADYRAALRRRPTADFRYGILASRGGMYLQAGRLDESVADLDAAIRLKPQAYHAYTTLAQLRRRQGRLEEASEAFARAIERAPDAGTRVALLRSRARLHDARRDATAAQRAAALRDLDEAIRLLPRGDRRSAEDHVGRARLLFAGSRPEEALAACREALRLVPAHPEAHRLRISALMALKRYGEVLSSCESYLSRERPTVEILEIRGLARVERRDYGEAVADFTRALDVRADLEPRAKSRLLNGRGWAYHFADAPRLALVDFEASLRLVPEQGDGFAGRGLARIRLGEWRPALADADAAARLAATSPIGGRGPDARRQAYLNAARIYALAIEFAADEVTRQGERAVAEYRLLRARGLALLQEALRQLPEERRASYWREVILPDPFLAPLRAVPGPGSPARGRPEGHPVVQHRPS